MSEREEEQGIDKRTQKRERSAMQATEAMSVESNSQCLFLSSFVAAEAQSAMLCEWLSHRRMKRCA